MFPGAYLYRVTQTWHCVILTSVSQHCRDVTLTLKRLKSLATTLLFNSLFRLTTKKTSQLRITGPLWGESGPLWGEPPLIKDHLISMVSCQKGPTRHAYAWLIGPFWQDTPVMRQPLPCHDVIVVNVAIASLLRGVSVAMGVRCCCVD